MKKIATLLLCTLTFATSFAQDGKPDAGVTIKNPTIDIHNNTFNTQFTIRTNTITVIPTPTDCRCTLDEAIVNSNFARHPFVINDGTYESAFRAGEGLIGMKLSGHYKFSLGMYGGKPSLVLAHPVTGALSVVQSGSTSPALFTTPYYAAVGTFALEGDGTAPTTAAGMGTGFTGAVTVVFGDSKKGVLRVITGSGCTPSDLIANVIFATSYLDPVAVTFSPANAAAASLGSASPFVITGMDDRFELRSGNTALTDNTVYEFSYSVTK